MSLLCTSRSIHSEVEIVLYQINEFSIWIDYDFDNKQNISIMGRPGYRVDFGLQHRSEGHTQEIRCMKQPPKMEMLMCMQLMHLQVGVIKGIREYDIMPVKGQTVSGPERPTYRSLVEVVQQLCGMLQKCHQIHLLRVSLRSIERTPGSIEKVMDPIRNLRGIKHTIPVVFSMRHGRWIDWNLKGSYGRYMNKIMAMPHGAAAPKYVGDEQEPNQDERNIFDMVGGMWMGGRSFAMPDKTDDDYIDDEDEEDEMNELDAEDAWADEDDDGFGMFMDTMDNGNYEEAFNIANGSLGPRIPVPPASFFDDHDVPHLGTFMPSAALTNAMANALPVPGLHEHLFGLIAPGLHHHHHHHHEPEDELD
jgi:hypothetical protein